MTTGAVAADHGATLGQVNPQDGAVPPTDDQTACTDPDGPADPPLGDGVEPPDDSSVGDAPPADLLDLDRIGRDLDGVESALRRLDDGTYWTDEVTGDPIPAEVLAADPVARRVEA